MDCASNWLDVHQFLFLFLDPWEDSTSQILLHLTWTMQMTWCQWEMGRGNYEILSSLGFLICASSQGGLLIPQWFQFSHLPWI